MGIGHFVVWSLRHSRNILHLVVDTLFIANHSTADKSLYEWGILAVFCCASQSAWAQGVPHKKTVSNFWLKRQ